MARSKTGRAIRTIGSSTYPVSVQGSEAHNFEEVKYKSTVPTGYDVRGKYEDLEIASTGAGEMLRIRGIASGTLSATGGTINAIHATGRVASGGTVSGALNAIRATLEVAGTTPTPGGTLAALQLDTNIVTGATLGANDAMIRVSNSGATKVTNLLNIEDASGGVATITAGTYSTSDGYLAIKVAGTAYRIPIFTGTDE
jgi:hypothetical protein